MLIPSFLSPYLDGDSPTRLLQGLAVGVIGTAVIGFAWGGWQLGSTVDERVEIASQAATVAALAPICADKFQVAAKANMDLIAEFKEVKSWERDSHLKKAGWVTFPGGAEPDDKVADACANLLTKSLKLT
jgi:hypothetical protein